MTSLWLVVCTLVYLSSYYVASCATKVGIFSRYQSDYVLKLHIQKHGVPLHATEICDMVYAGNVKNLISTL